MLNEAEVFALIRKEIGQMTSHKEFYEYFNEHALHMAVHANNPGHNPNCIGLACSMLVLGVYAKARREATLVADWLILQGQLLESIRLIEETPNETQAPGQTSGEKHLLAFLDSLASRRATGGSADE